MAVASTSSSVHPVPHRTTADRSDSTDNAARLQHASDFFEKHCRPTFPDVPSLTAAQVMSRQASGGERILFVDSRSPEEQSVSRIPGAVALQDVIASSCTTISGPGARGPTGSGKKTIAVVYCTIGGRSGEFLRDGGAAEIKRSFGEVEEVFNLELSLIGWTHAGGELEGPDLHATGRELEEKIVVKKVHAWGKLCVEMFPQEFEVVVDPKPGGPQARTMALWFSDLFVWARGLVWR